jgi:FkbM family methyltransferase
VKVTDDGLASSQAHAIDLRRIPEPVQRAMLRRYGTVSRLLPKGHRPYRVEGGLIHLDVTESKHMLTRAFGLFHNKQIHFLKTFLKRGMTFIDVGANKGDFSLIASRLLGDGGTVLAFEPEPHNHEWLRKSVELNGYGNVHTFRIALAEKNGKATLHLGEKSGYHTLVGGVLLQERGSIPVEVRTLDSILDELGIASFDMMKIDVEGAELQVLEGASQVLREAPSMAILLDIHPQKGADPLALGSLLRRYGFILREPDYPYPEIPMLQQNTNRVIATRGAIDSELPG